MISQEYNLDLIPNGEPLVVHVSQFDKESRTLIFNLYKGNVAYQPPEGVSANIQGTKPDATGFSYAMTIDGTSVSVILKEQMTAVAGNVPCEISLISGAGQKLGTANFVLKVERAALDSESVISESDIPIFEELVVQASTYVAQAEGYAEDAQQSAESASALIPQGGSAGQYLQKTSTGTSWSDVDIPTATSELTNDSGFITKDVNNLTNYTTTTDMNTALDNKVSKSGDSMTGVLNINSNIKFTAKAKGLYTLDSTNFEYPMIRDNGSNLWIGAEKTAGQHHRGATLISTGYNGTTGTGNESIELIVPNSTNTGGTGYKVWHEGNFERFYSNPSVNNTISVTDIMCVGWITGGQKDLVAYIPYPVLSGSASIQALSLNARMAQGGYPFIRSGASGGTYTQLGSSKVSLIANGSVVRTNEISSFNAWVRPNSGIQIAVSAVNQLTSNNTGTVVINNQPITVWLTATINLS